MLPSATRISSVLSFEKRTRFSSTMALEMMVHVAPESGMASCTVKLTNLTVPRPGARTRTTTLGVGCMPPCAALLPCMMAFPSYLWLLLLLWRLLPRFCLLRGEKERLRDWLLNLPFFFIPAPHTDFTCPVLWHLSHTKSSAFLVHLSLVWLLLPHLQHLTLEAEFAEWDLALLLPRDLPLWCPRDPFFCPLLGPPRLLPVTTDA